MPVVVRSISVGFNSRSLSPASPIVTTASASNAVKIKTSTFVTTVPLVAVNNVAGCASPHAKAAVKLTLPDGPGGPAGPCI